MTKICSKCLIEKPVSAFHYRKDNGKYRNECRACWKNFQAARTYKISIDQVQTYYQHPTCMCCDTRFTTKRDRHLHHVNHKVVGVLCMYCNIALGQETTEDLQRIEGVVNFMSRKNFFDRVNQQVRRDNGNRLETPTITRQSSLRQCKFCNQYLPLDSFYQQKRPSGVGPVTSCKSCFIIYNKSIKFGLTFEQVQVLQSTESCECCGKHFSKTQRPYIHHVGDNIRGVVCRRCNSLLEQESEVTKSKLNACLNWQKEYDMI